MVDNKKPNKYKKKPNGKNDTGRPSVMTEDTLRKLETAFKMGCSVTVACCHAEIGLSTFYDYTRDHPDYSAKIHAWQNNPILKAQNNVMRVLNGARNLLEKKVNEDGTEDRDPKSELTSREVLELSKWYLEHRNKSEYGTRVELTGADGEPLQSGSGIAEMLDLREKVKALSDKAKDENPDYEDDDED